MSCPICMGWIVALDVVNYRSLLMSLKGLVCILENNLCTATGLERGAAGRWNRTSLSN